jgi:hypothetical protein
MSDLDQSPNKMLKLTSMTSGRRLRSSLQHEARGVEVGDYVSRAGWRGDVKRLPLWMRRGYSSA